MYYLGFIRKTPLWCSIGFILGGSSSFVGAAALYILLVALHVLLCRIKSNFRTSGEVIFDTVSSDLTAPFRHVSIFLAIITKRHIIQDDSAWHNFTDFLETAFGFAWTVFIALFILSCLA